MLLSDIFTYLTHGELSQLSVSSQGYEITNEDYAKLASHIQLGLTDLYRRFLLKEKELILVQDETITLYYLRKEFAASNTDSQEPVKYILDTAQRPFLGDVLQVLSVVDEAGDDVPLNSRAQEKTSVYTPEYDVLQVPHPNSANMLSVLYKARHPDLNVTAATDPSTVTIDLPPFLVSPLLKFVASRVVGSVGKDGPALMASFAAAYELECRQIEESNLLQFYPLENTRLEDKGWA